MKINEVKGIPKELLKGKTVPLYKAFVLTNSEDEMKINTSIDLLAISKEDAVQELINNIEMGELYQSLMDLSNKTIISFAIIKIDKDDLLTKDLVDEGDPYFENGILSITLKDKKFKVDVVDNILQNIVINVDDKTQRKICTNIELIEA